MPYSVPHYQNNQLSDATIKLAEHDDNLFQLIKQALNTIASQELNKITLSASINIDSFIGRTLTKQDIESLASNFVPLYAVGNVYYIQSLASRFPNDEIIKNRIATAIRTIMIYGGFLYFVTDSVTETIDGKEMTKTYLRVNDNEVIRPITLEDILTAIGLMLENQVLLERLKNEIRI